MEVIFSSRSPTWNCATMSSDDVEEEISLPGLVGKAGSEEEVKRVGGGAPLVRGEIGMGLGTSNQEDDEEDDDDVKLEDIEETVSERLMGLTEMLPDKFWVVFGKTMKWSYWFVRRSAWVLGTSLALLALPPFLEQQRIEVQEMQTMQKKQMLLGPNQAMGGPLQGPR